MINTTTKLKLLDNKVAIEEIQEEQQQGSIYIPPSVSGNLKKGKVVAVGPGLYFSDGTLKSMQVQEGDVVYFQDYTETKIKFNSTDLFVIPESDIIAVVS